jgi:hypothetical protein
MVLLNKAIIKNGGRMMIKFSFHLNLAVKLKKAGMQQL